MHKIAIASNASKPEVVKCLLDYWDSRLFVDKKNGTEIEVRYRNDDLKLFELITKTLILF